MSNLKSILLSTFMHYREKNEYINYLQNELQKVLAEKEKLQEENFYFKVLEQNRTDEYQRCLKIDNSIHPNMSMHKENKEKVSQNDKLDKIKARVGEIDIK